MSLYPRRHRAVGGRPAAARWRRAWYLLGAAALACAVAGLGIILFAPVGWWYTAIALESAAVLLLLGAVIVDQHAEQVQAPPVPVLRAVPTGRSIDDAPTTPLRKAPR